MNPYYMQNYMPPVQQPQGMAIQNLPQQQTVKPTVVPYNVETPEQMSAIVPMPNTIYLGLNDKEGKIFIKRMNNDGLTEVKTFVLAGEQRKKTDTQEILERIVNIEKKLNIGGSDESNGNL